MDTNVRSGPKLTGDDPKRSIAEDEFGLGNMVRGLAKTLVDQVTADGYVVGVEGEWGTGKSTFVNFVAEEIENTSESHFVIRFEPWLLGTRDTLLANFFGLLISKIGDSKDDQASFWDIDRKQWRKLTSSLSRNLKNYERVASKLSDTATRAAILDPSGSNSVIAAASKAVSTAVSLLRRKPRSLEDLKAKIVLELEKLGELLPDIRFTVLIDDLDRLEPAEALEILRLVRKVADFPLVTYVVCFDRKILSHQVKTALAVENGNDFIEKIFQNVVAIPPQEPFALRRFLRKRLHESFAGEMDREEPQDAEFRHRKLSVLDTWAGKFLDTPRDVIRLHEAVKLGWNNICGRADFFDFVWLQIIKLYARDLYDWTQRYMVNVGAYRDAGRAGDNVPEIEAANFNEIMTRLNWGDRAYHSGITYFLPGIGTFLLEDETRRVFDFDSGELDRFERGRRLGSPSHWSLYFTFDTPSYAIRDDEMAAFISASSANISEASRIFRQLASRPHDVDGYFVKVLLERLINLPPDTISPESLSGMTVVFAEVMDDLFDFNLERFSEPNEIWQTAIGVIRRSETTGYEELFRSGRSFNWLADLLRNQGFAHGLPEGVAGPADPGRQWLSREELDNAVQILLQRLRGISPEDIFHAPQPLDILYFWLQLGSEEEFREFFRSATESDQLFLAALQTMRSRRTSAVEGVTYPVRGDFLAHFADADAARGRLEILASSEPEGSPLGEEARELLEVWQDASF